MGFNEFMTKLFGNKSQRDLKEITPYVDKIKAVYPSIQKLSNDELRAKTDEIKQRIQDYVADERAKVEELRKGIDNKEGTADVGHPLMTLTCYSNGSAQELRLNFEDRTARGDADQKVFVLKKTDLAPFLEEWVEAEEVARFGAEGTYRIVIKRISDGKVLFTYSNSNLDMWRTGSTGLRPKWGIYRYIGDDRTWEDQLRDEQLLYADFSVVKGEPSGLQQVVTENNAGKRTDVYGLDGGRRNVDASGIYIKNGKKYLRK